jgi:hypothetical protein
MAFLSVNNSLETIVGIMAFTGIVLLINHFLEKNERLRNLAKIIWVAFSIIIINMIVATFYSVMKTK